MTFTTDHSTGSVRHTHLAGIAFGQITARQVAERVVRTGLSGLGEWIVTANLDHARQYATDQATRTLIDAADLVVADGMPIVWASRLAGSPLPERVAGSDIIYTVAEEAARVGGSVYFLGGNPGAAAGCAARLRLLYPELKVAGIHCPEFGFETDKRAMEQISDAIARADPAVVLVALGFPKQDHVIRELRSSLARPAYLGVGISFSFVSGDRRRAPRIFQIAGLEWLHRLMSEPRRLAKRYLWHDIPFVARLFTDAAYCRAHMLVGDAAR